MKQCIKCLITKDTSEFPIKKINKDGLYSYCKKCKSNENRKYRKLHKKDYVKRNKLYYEKNREKIKTQNKVYYLENYISIRERQRLYNSKISVKKRKNELIKIRKSKDPLFKLISNLRVRTNDLLRKKKLKKNKSFDQYIGCSQENLKLYLEAKFTDGMNWENYGKFGWHIDHIIPLSSATSEEELYGLCHYTNLQPLWAIDNLKKGDVECLPRYF